MKRSFAKYEGLGNDFVVLDGDTWPVEELTSQRAIALCDRHRGVGADGVLWVQRTSELAARLIIVNADGTRPEMCGNGVRCVAAFFVDRGWMAQGQTLSLMTDAGERTVQSRGEHRYAVAMGLLRVESQPFVTLDVRDLRVPVFFADAGNPHAVVFSEVPLRHREAVAARIRQETQKYPQGTNVEFVSGRAEGGLRVQVHERGVGWTLACGTGACAVATVHAAKHTQSQGETTVELDGGSLEIIWKSAAISHLEPTLESTQDVFETTMIGPAVCVFEGAIS
ncbi:MAG: diaminopimelate epimerase [Deltaproteobacteria bacterium]|nr:diaminopimelate epimerase [Deltaproteobacteria bacterium]